MNKDNDYKVQEKKITTNVEEDGSHTATCELVVLYPDGRLEVASTHQSEKCISPKQAIQKASAAADRSEDQRSPEAGRECRMTPPKVYGQSIKKKKKKSEAVSVAEPPPEPATPSNPFQYTEDIKHHWPPADNKTGKNNQSMDEPVPDVALQPGSVEVSAATFGAVNNNASIIFGRDRTGDLEFFSKEVTFSSSGFSTYQGAGAIDIAVGRGAPFAVTHYGKTEAGTARKIVIGPQLGTSPQNPDLARVKLGPTEGQKTFDHPGYMMTAARIYMSQKSDVDAAFNLYPKKPNPIPTSSIALKSDKIRLIARQDLVLTTLFMDETVNSQGNTINSVGEGISLVAGNGKLASMKNGDIQGIAKGKNTEQAIDAVLDLIVKFVNIFNGMMISQQAYNAFLMNHFHLSPLFLARTSPDYLVHIMGCVNQADTVTRGVAGIPALMDSVKNIKAAYTSERFGAKTISSRWNKTN